MLASLVQASSIPPGREITSRLHTHRVSRSGEPSAPPATGTTCRWLGQGMLKVFQPLNPCVT